jgi:riboflavin synthase
MFTGIVEQQGQIIDVRNIGNNSLQFDIDCHSLNNESKIGDSISINGICLTVERKTTEFLTFTAISETLQKTNIKGLVSNKLVNIEPSATMEKIVGGHPMTGHIDKTEKVLKIEATDIWKVVRISLDKDFRNLIVNKGSVTVNGVSLTVSKVEDTFFEVSLIPETLKSTNLNDLKLDDLVNIEFDQVGKYIAQNMKLQNER